GLEFMGVDRGIDCFLPQFDGDLVRDELALARVLEKCLAYLAASIDRAKNIAARTMIKTRDAPERFTLCALTTTGMAKKDVGFVFHGHTSFILQLGLHSQPLKQPVNSHGLQNLLRRDDGIDVYPPTGAIKTHVSVDQGKNRVVPA